MEKKESEKPVVRNDSVAPTMAKTEQTIDKSRRVCTLSHVMIEMLVKQLGAELSNHNLYRTFANYFSCQGLPKLEEYFILRADEEDNHHNWILWYLNYNDAEFQYPRIEAINVDIPNRAYPFEATVDREIETTESINKIVKQAIQEGDWATEAWLKVTTMNMVNLFWNKSRRNQSVVLLLKWQMKILTGKLNRILS